MYIIGNIIKANSENITISVLDGEMSDIIARSDFPEAKTNSLTQLSEVSQLLLEISQNKADITFVEPVIAYEFMNANPNSIKVARRSNVE